MDNLIIFLAKDLVVVVAVLAIIVWLKLPNKLKKEMAVALVLTGLAAVILTKIAGAIYYHPRPFIVQHITPLIAHSNDNGLPSEHTVLAASLTSLIYFYRKKLALVALILTLAIGAGRVRADVHSPLDIVGGLLIGVIAGWLGYQLSKRLIPSRLSPKVEEKAS